MKHFYRILLCAALPAGFVTAAIADEAETLRVTQIQLRQSEQERSALRAEVARLQEQLSAQNQALNSAQRAAPSQAACAGGGADGELAAKLNQSVKVARAGQIELQQLRLQSAQQSQAVQNMRELLEHARGTIAQRDEFVELCRVRNGELYQLGRNVLELSRKDEMSSLAAREPVLQLQRVKLENVNQELETKLREQRIFEDTLTPSQEKTLRENMERKAAAAEKPAP